LRRAPHTDGQDALATLVATTYSDVWRFCSVLVEPDLADDLAQETFMRATSALQRFRGQASTRTWIFAIARHVCVDELRRRQRRRRRDERLAATADQLHDPDPSTDIAANELLAQLDPDRRAAFALTQLFRLSYQEAAVVCGCPSGTIRSRVARARDDLIALISPEDRATQRGHEHRLGAGLKRPQAPGGNV